MNYFQNFIFNGLQIIICICLLLCLCGCDMLTNEEEYKNLGQAVEKTADKRGWVPEYLPTTSNQIKVIYNLDSNELWGSFNFAPNKNELFRIISVCKIIKPKFIKFPSIGFWRKPPDALRQKVSKEFTIYKCNSREFVSINSLGKGYYWYTDR